MITFGSCHSSGPNFVLISGHIYGFFGKMTKYSPQLTSVSDYIKPEHFIRHTSLTQDG